MSPTGAAGPSGSLAGGRAAGGVAPRATLTAAAPRPAPPQPEPRPERSRRPAAGARPGPPAAPCEIVAHQLVESGLAIGVGEELLAARIAVAARAHRPRVVGRPQNGRADEHHQVGAGAGAAARAEQLADHRDVAQQRDPFEGAAVIVVEQPTDADDLAVVDDDGVLGLALIEDQVLEIV